MMKKGIIAGIIAMALWAIVSAVSAWVQGYLAIYALIVGAILAICIIVSCVFYYRILVKLNQLHIRALFSIKVVTHGIFIIGIFTYVAYSLREYMINISYPINPTSISSIVVVFASILLFYITIVAMFPTREVSNIGFVATCFPLKYDANSSNIKTRLIFNPNHNEWMFPGGHVDVQRGDVPSQVAKEKAEQEAGVVINNGFINFDGGFSKYQHCMKLHSPCFTYKMSVKDSVACRKTMGHSEHIDYIFIGEYETLPNNKQNNWHKFIDVEIEVDTNDTSKEELKNLLHQCIQAHNNNTTGQHSSEVRLLEDIPERLYIAIQKYKRYKKLEHANKAS